MGRLDVGQSVAVKERAVLAVEAIEGTDRCIERAGQLCRAGGWTLVKVAKPQQDMRFDVPTVGTSTIENLHQAGARVLAIEAGKTIVIDQPEVVALADRYGLAIVALTRESVTVGSSGAVHDGSGAGPFGGNPASTARTRISTETAIPRLFESSTRSNWCGSVGSARCIVRSNWARRRSRSRAARRAVRIETPIRSASRVALAFSGAMIRTERSGERAAAADVGVQTMWLSTIVGLVLAPLVALRRRWWLGGSAAPARCSTSASPTCASGPSACPS